MINSDVVLKSIFFYVDSNNNHSFHQHEKDPDERPSPKPEHEDPGTKEEDQIKLWGLNIFDLMPVRAYAFR